MQLLSVHCDHLLMTPIFLLITLVSSLSAPYPHSFSYSTTLFSAQDGCENCSNVELRHTTPTFHGMIAMMKPRESWVSKWQKQDKLVPGMYAISVSGVMPDEDEQYDDE